MDLSNHVPSLTHLRDFARARTNNRPTHVAQDRKQVSAPSDDRIFAFAYERFLTGVVNYVGDGNRGAGLRRVVAEANDRMRHSYEDCANGMAKVLTQLQPLAVGRRQRNVVVRADDGYEVVSLRVHLIFQLSSGPVAAFMYFPEQRLTQVDLAIMETAVALAARQIDSAAKAAIIMVRSGLVHFIDAGVALEPTRIGFLRSESIAYRAAWAEAA